MNSADLAVAALGALNIVMCCLWTRDRMSLHSLRLSLRAIANGTTFPRVVAENALRGER